MSEAPSNPLLNLIRYGTVDAVDLTACRATINVGGNLTAPLPWIEGRAGDVATWSPPTKGEQVLVLAPGGVLAAAVFLRGIYSDAKPAPSVAGETNDVKAFADGAVIAYDWTTHQLSAVLPDGAQASLVATGGIDLTGPVNVNGDLTINGKTHAAKTITSDEDVVASGISLKNHKHPGVSAGTTTTGVPQ